MGKAEDFTSEKLNLLFESRGQRVLRRFGEAAVSGVKDTMLLSILNEVKEYWKDNFRPTLVSLCCEAVGGKSEAADDASLMITLASAGGGIHDDIIDKSLNKHFRNTVYGLHGLDYAVLLGDFLILKGWATVKEVVARNSKPELLAQVIEVFGNWTLDVCEAEFMEVSCRKNLDTELERYQRILWKSMADTEACARLGAVFGGGSKEEVQILADFGGRLGFIFRLSNDITDTISEEGSLSYRLQNESVPLPILFAAKQSKKNYATIKSIVDAETLSPVDFRKLLELCVETQAFSYLLKLAEKNAKEASEKLLSLKSTSARNILEFMIKKTCADISKRCI